MKNTFQVYDWVLPIDNYLNLESAKPLFDPDITSQYINLLSLDQSEDEEKDLSKVPISDPIYIPKPEHKSTLSYTPSPGESPFKESYLKVVGEEDDMYKFFSLLAKNESGYDPKAKNPNAPAYGYFQFMQDGVDYHNISDYGDVDIDTFLNTPEIQINAARALADSFLSHLNEEDLAKMAEKGITRSGALGGMWLGGYGGLKRYLYNNENVSDTHWDPSGAGTNMEKQIKIYNGLFKKGGRIEKASLGTIFSTNEPRGQRRSGVEMSSINKSNIPDLSNMYYNAPLDIKPVVPNPFDDRIGKYMDGHTKEKEYELYLPYSEMIKSISNEYGLPEHILIHLASTESHFDPNALNSKTGASGLMQIMPASMAKYKSDGLWRDDLSDVENNIRAGAHILKYFYGVYKDWKKAFMAYKGIAKDKRVPTHPEHEYLIKKNKIDYLMSYVE